MDPEIYAKLKKVIVRELRVEEEIIQLDSEWERDLGASLDIVCLFMECEDVFGIKIPDEDAIYCRNPGELTTYITNKLGRIPPEGGWPEPIASYQRPKK